MVEFKAKLSPAGAGAWPNLGRNLNINQGKLSTAKTAHRNQQDVYGVGVCDARQQHLQGL